MSLPRIERVDGRPRLVVDDRPFFILGLQWDCESCFTPEAMNPLFPHAARMGANTAALPVYWREIEPRPGSFDFRLVDERIKRARENGLRIVLLWFATWKNGSPFYAPEDVRANTATYRRTIDREGTATESLCPNCDATWARDRDALVALMGYLRDNDTANTVIVMQVENESGVLRTDRCYCERCNGLFAEGNYETTWGVGERAAESFSAVSLARYIDRLAGEAKAIKNLPTYTNAWLSPVVGGTPGDYPSGGPVPQVLRLYLSQLQQLDFVSPDIYTSGFRDFGRLCGAYAESGNPLYIAEHSSTPDGRAEKNVFYSLGHYGAIGFDPWAVDSPHPDWYAPPLVDPVGFEWGPQAFWLRDSYVAIGRALEPIVEAQGTERLFTFVQEQAERGTGWSADGCDLIISYHDREKAARGFIVQKSRNEFLVIGLGVDVRFRHPETHRPIEVLVAEWGRFHKDQWVTIHPIRREFAESEGSPITLLEPGVARVVLKPQESN